MENKKLLIDANALMEEVDKSKHDNPHPPGIVRVNHRNEHDHFWRMILDAPTVDAVEVVRCKDCRWARPYERTDGETGYYCHFCGHSFKYGTNWERLFTPIKESDDFCSYGERKDNGNLH